MSQFSTPVSIWPPLGQCNCAETKTVVASCLSTSRWHHGRVQGTPQYVWQATRQAIWVERWPSWNLTIPNSPKRSNYLKSLSLTGLWTRGQGKYDIR